MSDFWVPQDLSDFMKFGSDVMKFMVFDTFLDRYLITFKEGFGYKMGQKGVPKRVQKVTKRGQKPKISRARGDSLTNITWSLLWSSESLLGFAPNPKMFWDQKWPIFDQKRGQKWGSYPPNGSVPRGPLFGLKERSVLITFKEGFGCKMGQKGGPKMGQKCVILGVPMFQKGGPEKWPTRFRRPGYPKMITFWHPFEQVCSDGENTGYFNADSCMISCNTCHIAKKGSKRGSKKGPHFGGVQKPHP